MKLAYVFFIFGTFMFGAEVVRAKELSTYEKRHDVNEREKARLEPRRDRQYERYHRRHEHRHYESRERQRHVNRQRQPHRHTYRTPHRADRSYHRAHKRHDYRKSYEGYLWGSMIYFLLRDYERANYSRRYWQDRYDQCFKVEYRRGREVFISVAQRFCY